LTSGDALVFRVSHATVAWPRRGGSMATNHRRATAVKADEGQLTPNDVRRLFDGGYRDVDVMPDGSIRVAPGDGSEEAAVSTLKTGRTWYRGEPRR
jgi:hypothetical protein